MFLIKLAFAIVRFISVHYRRHVVEASGMQSVIAFEIETKQSNYLITWLTE